ncbi:MAG: hypothetical protein Q3976_02830 [Corynebacterium sp.]|nr:hypothetical protein [Corynebacterium sp.]
MNAFASLLENPEIQAATSTFIEKSRQVHRRPVNLRKYDITHSESVLRGARANSWLANLTEETSINAYSVLAPNSMDAQVRTLLRAPLQVFARLDSLAGGTGQPTQGAAQLQGLAKLFDARILNQYEVLVPIWIHNHVLAQDNFAARTGTIARISLRLSLVASGADTLGLGVPETGFWRHKQQYFQIATNPQSPDSMLCVLDALRAGMDEAAGIAAAAA